MINHSEWFTQWDNYDSEKNINFWQLNPTQPNPFHRRKFRTQPNPWMNQPVAMSARVGWLRRNFAKTSVLWKLEWLSYHIPKKVWWYFKPFRDSIGALQTDGQNCYIIYRSSALLYTDARQKNMCDLLAHHAAAQRMCKQIFRTFAHIDFDETWTAGLSRVIEINQTYTLKTYPSEIIP